MPELLPLLANNRAWAERATAADPEFFHRLVAQQAPDYLWIGCSDSRVPATQLVGLLPGDMFVHRNVANVVVQTDLNCLAVLQYAVDVLRVQHIIVCGHYGCGGVEAALHNRTFGLIDNWLRNVQEVRDKHTDLLAACADDGQRLQRLCELNVIEQVANVCRSTVLQTAWARQQPLVVHGWVYGIENGLLHDLQMTVTNAEQLAPQYAHALELLGQ